MAEVAPELLEYYALGKEKDRLSSGLGAVEFARTKELIGRTLPTAPGGRGGWNRSKPEASTGTHMFRNNCATRWSLWDSSWKLWRVWKG